MATRLGAEEVVVPDAQQAQQHRQILLQRGGAEMLVHGVEAGEHLAEIVRPDGDHQRQADGRVVRIAAADPVPELEHVGRVDAELRHFGRVGRDGHEVFGDRFFVARASCRHQVAGRMGVGQRFQGGEGFGRDDEQRFGRIEIADGLGQIAAVDIRDEAERQIAVGCNAAGLRRPSPAPGRSRRCRY